MKDDRNRFRFPLLDEILFNTNPMNLYGIGIVYRYIRTVCLKIIIEIS